jgi:glycosyltransferase involved in cell wall biosynthesis
LIGNRIISVIIPTYNEEKHIAACLDSLLSQETSFPIEIIIVDNGSKDKTTKIVEEYVKRFSNKIKLIKLGKNIGPGGARNLGAKNARGEILVFIDADMVLDKKYIEKIVMPIMLGETISTTHTTEYILNIENPWVKVQGQKVKKIYGKEAGEAFRAIRKDFFLLKNGFDSRYGYHDDRTFFKKTGIKAKLVEDAICYHNNPDTIYEIFRRNKWIANTLLLIAKEKMGVNIKELLITIMIRTIELLSIPLLILAFVFFNNFWIKIIFSLPFIFFIYLSIRQKILETFTLKEKIILRLIYVPFYRLIKALGFLIGIISYFFKRIINFLNIFLAIIYCLIL